VGESCGQALPTLLRVRGPNSFGFGTEPPWTARALPQHTRIHGPDGLKEFTYAKSVAQRRFPAVLALTTFARTAKVDKLLATLTVLRHG